MSVFRRGNKGAEIEKLQRRLKKLGHYGGGLDGDFGPGMERALRAFQRAEGLSVDGVAGAATLSRLEGSSIPAMHPAGPPDGGSVPEPTPTPTPTATLRRGSAGEEAKRLQEMLKSLGHYSGGIDGDFGPGTERALKAFQRAEGLSVDGVAGPATLARLDEASLPAIRPVGDGGSGPTPATGPTPAPIPTPTSTPDPSPPPTPEAASTQPPASPEALLRMGSSGGEVKQLQEQLKALGHYRGPADGDFGGGTLSAVISFQQSAGLGADGLVGKNTWHTLFKSEIPVPEIVGRPLNHRCLALTGAFEIGRGFPECFAGLSGDFDGQGTSFGVLQWNFGQNTLQPLLGEMITNHRELTKSIFQNHFDTLVEKLEGEKEVLMDFARSIQHSEKHYVLQPWRGMFKALGRTEECQEIQVRLAGGLFSKALELCDEYELWSERAAALMFDIKVQNGSINSKVKGQITEDIKKLPAGLSDEEREVEKMRIVANRRAEASYTRWIEDVRERKLCCANGEGSVHGVDYDIATQFGLMLRRR